MAGEVKWRSVPPNKEGKEESDINLWVDYIEMACILSYDGEMSQADMVDEVRQVSADFINEGRSEDEDDLDASEIDLDWTLSGRDWVEYIKKREKIFGSYYPFEFRDDQLLLKRKTIKRKIYLSMVLASNLHSSSKEQMQRLTTSFEYISYHALKRSLPKKSKVFLFGKNMLNKGSKYSGKLIKKIETLGKELDALPVVCNEEDFANQDSGDGGLDVFGYVPLDSRITNNVPIFFGQCACGKDWKKKIYECHATSWRENLTFSNTSEPSHMIFIPYSYRNLNGSWVNGRHRKESIIFDRERITNKLGTGDNRYFNRLPAKEIVDSILAS